MSMMRRYAGPFVWGCLILAFLLAFAVINFCGFERFCTADMYSDTLVSKFMWEQKSLFPEGWVFGNQFYVFVTPVVAAVIYGLCGSVNLAMILATSLMTLLIMLSFWWMIRPFASREQILAGLAVLLGCVIGPDIVADIEGQILYILASYYAGYMIALFLVFGDYIRVLYGKDSGWLVPVIGILLSFATGMQSLRQMAVMILPLLAVEGIRVISGIARRERGIWRRKSFWRVAAYTAANLAGLVAIRILDPASVSIYGDLSLNGPEEFAACVSTALRALRSITGLKYLGGDTILLGAVAGTFVLAAVAAVVLALRRRLREGDQCLILLFLCSLLCVSGIGIVVNISIRSIYLFPWYGMIAVCGVLLLKQLQGWRKHTVSAVLALVLTLNLFGSYGPAVRSALQEPDPYEKKIAEYVEAHGYTRLYGGWPTVTNVAVWTDGDVEAGIWFEDVCAILPYINAQQIYGEADNRSAVYLVRAGEEAAFLQRAEQLGAQLQLQIRFDGTALALYTSDRQLMFHAGQGE